MEVGKPDKSSSRTPNLRLPRLPKSKRLLHRCLRIGRFDLIAQISELANHSPRALILGSYVDSWASFLVTDSLMQDQPDQTTLSVGNDADGLIMSEARNATAIDNLEDASFDFYGAVGSPDCVSAACGGCPFSTGGCSSPRRSLLRRGRHQPLRNSQQAARAAA